MNPTTSVTTQTQISFYFIIFVTTYSPNQSIPQDSRIAPWAFRNQSVSSDNVSLAASNTAIP